MHVKRHYSHDLFAQGPACHLLLLVKDILRGTVQTGDRAPILPQESVRLGMALADGPRNNNWARSEGDTGVWEQLCAHFREVGQEGWLNSAPTRNEVVHHVCEIRRNRSQTFPDAARRACQYIEEDPETVLECSKVSSLISDDDFRWEPLTTLGPRITVQNGSLLLPGCVCVQS